MLMFSLSLFGCGLLGLGFFVGFMALGFGFFWPKKSLLFWCIYWRGKHKSGFQLRRFCPLWILRVYKCIGMLLLCINVYMLLFLNFSTFITILKNKSLGYWLTCLLACNSLSPGNKRSNISLNVCPDKYKWKLRKGQIYLCFPIPEPLQSVLSNLISRFEKKLLRCE